MPSFLPCLGPVWPIDHVNNTEHHRGCRFTTVLVEFLGNQVLVSAANTRSAIPSSLMRRATDGYHVQVHIPLEPKVAGSHTQELLQEITHPKGSTSAPTTPIVVSATFPLPNRHSLLPSTHLGPKLGDQFHTEVSRTAEDLCGVQKYKRCSCDSPCLFYD